eukprot:7846906-Pyramimonas_sp.AAC.2
MDSEMDWLLKRGEGGAVSSGEGAQPSAPSYNSGSYNSGSPSGASAGRRAGNGSSSFTPKMGHFAQGLR